MIGGFLVHKWAKNPSILYNSAIGHLIKRSFADTLWVCMRLLVAQKCFEQFRAAIKIIPIAQNNSCIPVPVRLKQIIETEGHRDMNMNTKISARILILVQSGMTLPQAFDAVLGAGAYAKMAGEVYDALRA